MLKYPNIPNSPILHIHLALPSIQDFLAQDIIRQGKHGDPHPLPTLPQQVAQVSHVYAWGIREEQDLRASPEPALKTQEQLPREQQKRENPQEQGVKTEGILQEKTRKDAQKPLD